MLFFDMFIRETVGGAVYSIYSDKMDGKRKSGRRSPNIRACSRPSGCKTDVLDDDRYDGDDYFECQFK